MTGDLSWHVAPEISRTDNSIKNHWNSRLHKRAKERAAQQHQQAQAQALLGQQGQQPEAGSPPNKRQRVQAAWPAAQEGGRPTTAAGNGQRLAPGTPRSDPQPVEIVRRCAEATNVRLITVRPVCDRPHPARGGCLRRWLPLHSN